METSILNILHISRTMDLGGAERVVYQLVVDCKNNNYYVASCGGALVRELNKKGIKHIYIPDIENKNPIVIFFSLIKLVYIINRYKIDIIHSHHRMAAFYARVLQMINRELRHIYTAHNVFHRYRFLMRFALSRAIVVACGNTVRNNLANEYGIDYNRIIVIRNSINEKKFHRASIYCPNQNQYPIAFVGRITYIKGIDLFIKSISIITKIYPNVVGVVIGDGEDKEKAVNLAKKLDIQHHLIFVGRVDDPNSIVSKMKFVVLPSRREGFPLVPIEVFSIGKTVISSDIDSNKEIVLHGFNGLCFRSGDYKDLSRKAIRIIRNNDLREQLEYNAMISYNTKYSYDKFIKKYEKVYDMINKVG